MIAPRAVAFEEQERRPRRGTRTGEHGKDSVSATGGTELTVIDRERHHLRAFDDGPRVDVFIAGRAARLCAKAYEIHDGLDAKERARNADRLRPKDFADMFRLVLCEGPEAAAATFARGAQTDRIGPAVQTGAEYLVDLLSDVDFFAVQVADAWQGSERQAEFADHVNKWRAAFVAA